MKRTLTILLALLAVLTVAAEPSDAKTVDINITGSYTFYFDVDDEEETSDWFFSATDDTGMYTVRLDWPADYDGKYGTFTLADIDKDYSYIKDYSTGELEYRDYVEGTTFTVSENNGKLHIEGTLVCNNGVTYNLHFDHTPQTFNIEGTELTDIYYFDEDTDWYLCFNDDKYRVSLDINTGRQSKFAGTYTEKDAVEDYNFVSDVNTGSYDPFVEFTVKFALPKGVTDPTKACEITGTALTEHGDTYNFHMLKGLPIVPKKTVDVDVDLKTIEWPTKRDDCKSYFEFTEKNADGSASENQWNIGLDAMTGELSTSDFVDSLTARINNATGEMLKVDNGTVSIHFDSSTYKLNISAALVMKDSVEYKFTADYDVPIKGEVALNFDNLTLNDSYYSDMGYQWLYASNDKASIEVTLTNAAIPGEYDDNTMSVAMAVTADDGFKSAVNSAVILDAYTEIDEHNQPVLSAKFLGSNKRIYTVEAYYAIPAIEDTLNICVDGLKAYDYLQTLGAFQIFGYSKDSTVYVSIAPEATKFAGHYTTEDLMAYSSYCVLALQKEDGTYETNDIYTADFDVTQEDKAITLVGTFQAGKHFVNMTLNATIKPQGIDYDSEDEDLDVSFSLDDLTELEKGKGYAYVELQNAERSDVFSMLIYLDEFDDDIVIPEGTYEVNDSYTAPSVQPGLLSSNSLYPTFYATLSDGYLYTPFWFLESGTVTVAKTTDNTLSFEVNGQNSYERKFHVTLGDAGTGINDVVDGNAKAGDCYNLAGQKVKASAKGIIIRQGKVYLNR